MKEAKAKAKTRAEEYCSRLMEEVVMMVVVDEK